MWGLFRKINIIFPNIHLNWRDNFRKEVTFYSYWSIFCRIVSCYLVWHWLLNLEFLGLSWGADKYMPELITSSTCIFHRQLTLTYPKLRCFSFSRILFTLFRLMVPSQKHGFHPRIDTLLNPHRELVYNSHNFCIFNVAPFYLGSHALIVSFITPLSRSDLFWPNSLSNPCYLPHSLHSG